MSVPVFKVLKILDKTTLVVGGDAQVVDLIEGERLVVLSVGQEIVEGLDAPLVVPKAQVEVTTNAGAYVFARPEETVTEHEVSTPSGLSYLMGNYEKREKVKKSSRPFLSVAESQISGNPARVPIQIGDPVVKERDLKDFVQELAKLSKK